MAATKKTGVRQPRRGAGVAQLAAQSHGLPHAERAAAGKALRSRSPRRSIAGWKPAAGRVDPIDQLVASSAGRTKELLTLRHKRSGDAVKIAAYMGTSAVIEDAMTALAATYADQNERDHAALVAAVRSRRLEIRADA